MKFKTVCVLQRCNMLLATIMHWSRKGSRKKLSVIGKILTSGKKSNFYFLLNLHIHCLAFLQCHWKGLRFKSEEDGQRWTPFENLFTKNSVSSKCRILWNKLTNSFFFWKKIGLVSGKTSLLFQKLVPIKGKRKKIFCHHNERSIYIHICIFCVFRTTFCYSTFMGE